MRNFWCVAVALGAITACGKKQDDASGAASSAAAGSAATAPVGKPTEPAPPAAKPPTITPEMLFSDEPTWSVQALPRGIYVRSGTGPIEHKCRMDLAMVLAKNGQQRAAAKKVVTEGTDTATVCAPKGSLTVCTFTDPTGDPAVNPASVVHWVFTGTDSEPVLIGVMTGLMSDWDAVATAVAKVEPCPRPSDDPEYK